MRTPILLFLLGIAVYAAFAGQRLKIHTPHNHFVYQAMAFLEGEAELVRPPPNQNDWASYDELQLKGKSAAQYGPAVKGFFTGRSGKPREFRTLKGEHIEIPHRDRGEKTVHHFVSFPPAPAVLMMPFAAAVAYGTNDVVFTVLFAALNGVLAFLLLQLLSRRGYTQRTERENVWLTILFVFGSNHLWSAVRGEVWFTALIVGVTFHLAYLLFALDARKPFWAGLMLAWAFASRASLVLAAGFFYWQLLRPASGERFERKDQLKRFVLFSAPPLVAGLLLLWFNQVRFHNPMEFGHTYLAGGRMPRIRDFGLFHPAFLKRNLHAAFTLTPRFIDKAPHFQISKHGMSLFLSTPALVFLFRPKRWHRVATPALVGLVLLFGLILLYQNTGWVQYGYRFSLDFLPYVLILLAVGAPKVGKLFQGLILVGVLVNAVGAAGFGRTMLGKYTADFGCPEPKLEAPKKR